jgi:acetyl esterase/lipase
MRLGAAWCWSLPLLVVPAASAGEEARGVALTARFSVRTVKDVAYYAGKDADPVKHKLDLYLPRDHKGFPIVLFIHGGAWQRGGKDSHFGVYGGVGSFLAKHGVGMAVANYRLSPAVRHPEHIRDVARAFAWVHKHIADEGGDPGRVFVSGHSAGGHLVSLLATDASYLEAHHLSPRQIRGVISLSGVYELPPNVFAKVFGADAAAREKAWPLTHVKMGLPPFLVLYAEKDLPGCDKDPAECFCKALKEKGNEVKSLEAAAANHYSILLRMAVPDDPVSRAILTFVQTRAAPQP